QFEVSKSCFLRTKAEGPPRERPPRSHYGQSAAVADEPLLMQLDARPKELPIVLPSVTAAMAMAPPTIARISAYSAADAPDSSCRRVMKAFMSHPFHTFLPFAPDERTCGAPRVAEERY